MSEPKTKIFVGSLSFDVRSNHLEDHFSQYGKVVDAIALMEKDNPNRARGFGFVTFAEESSAQNAINGSNGKELEGRAMKVSIAENKPKRNNDGW